MARFLADENFHGPVVLLLREAGHDVVTVGDLGLKNRGVPDRMILQIAADLGRAVLTFDRDDYRDLHGAGVAHAGVIACTFDSDHARLARNISAAVAAEESLACKLIRVVRGG